MTLTPTTTIYNDVVPGTERNLDDARMSDADYVAKTTPVTARLVRDALYDTLDQIDPRFNRNHPQRTAAHARLAVLLVPALKVKLPVLSFVKVDAFIAEPLSFSTFTLLLAAIAMMYPFLNE